MRPSKKPKILILGAEFRMNLMIELYGLNDFDGIAVTDRDSSRWGKTVNNLHVSAPKTLDLSQLDLVIIAEPEAPSMTPFLAAKTFLKELKVPEQKIATIYEPGKINRILMPLAKLDEFGPMALGYRLVYHDVFERAQFGYGVMLAAEQARRMNLKSVSLVETGVWFGAGLKSLCEWSDLISQTQGMEFRVFGFDTGAGLPPVKDWRDHPELWLSGSMRMPDFEKLRSELPPFCQLILGDVEKTIPEFLETQASANSPVGFFSLDVDLYTSSVSALKLFDAKPGFLMPATIVWVDDSYINVMQNNHCGEALAISEYNARNPLRKIEQKIVRTDRPSRLWHHCYWFAHIFDHPVRQGEQSANFDGFFHINY
jgi:hypothetical protein